MQKERYEDNHIDTELTEYYYYFSFLGKNLATKGWKRLLSAEDDGEGIKEVRKSKSDNNNY